MKKKPRIPIFTQKPFSKKDAKIYMKSYQEMEMELFWGVKPITKGSDFDKDKEK